MIQPTRQPLTSSIQAFIAVLKIRFKDIGLHKIESGEFALEDSRSKRGLQLAKPWTAIIRPGQHINMSMVFRLEEQQTARCPGCGEENAGSDLEDIKWYIYTAYNRVGTDTNESRSGNKICGITYRKIVEKPGSESQLQGPSQAKPFTNDEMQYYTRLHIVTQATVNGVEYTLGVGHFDSIGNFTTDETVEQRKRREDEPSFSSEDRPHDRWARIQEKAAERAERRISEMNLRVSQDKMEDGEESAESKSSIISTAA